MRLLFVSSSSPTISKNICRNLLFPKKPDQQETYAILGLITASHLNTFPPQLSLERPFTDQLDWPQFSAQHASEFAPLYPFTSLGFFVSDVERLLLDLYGNVIARCLDGSWALCALSR